MNALTSSKMIFTEGVLLAPDLSTGYDTSVRLKL